MLWILCQGQHRIFPLLFLTLIDQVFDVWQDAWLSPSSVYPRGQENKTFPPSSVDSGVTFTVLSWSKIFFSRYFLDDPSLTLTTERMSGHLRYWHAGGELSHVPVWRHVMEDIPTRVRPDVQLNLTLDPIYELKNYLSK